MTQGENRCDSLQRSTPPGKDFFFLIGAQREDAEQSEGGRVMIIPCSACLIGGMTNALGKGDSVGSTMEFAEVIDDLYLLLRRGSGVVVAMSTIST